MKTMEQKAKAYDEAIERAREWSETKNGYYMPKELCEEIFPELKESEGDRIKKEITELVMQPTWKTEKEFHRRKELCDWLEKQGEQNPAEWHREDEQNLNACLGFIPDEYLRRWLMDVVHVKYNKPADKIEPKFHEGEWVMLDRPVLITKVEDMPYNTHRYWTSDGTWFGDGTDARLWSIEDAKDGDVLVYGDNPDDHHIEIIMLFKSIRNMYSAFTHFHMYDDVYSVNDWCDCKENAHPATKEQRDLLFQKMKEAGYEWDAEKKKLRKTEQKPVDTSGVNSSTPMPELDTIDDYIEYLENLHRMDDELSLKHLQLKEWLIELKTLREQKPEWSEKDEECFKEVELNFKLNHDDMTPALVECYDRFFAKLKSLKDKTIPQPKQEWSEEDEDDLNNIIWLCNNCIRHCECTWVPDQATRIKSLIERIKNTVFLQPKQEWSEEDENCLSTIIAEFSKCAGKSVSKDEWMRCNDFLNSLRDRVYPKQEWSEEDKKKLNRIYLLIAEAANTHAFSTTCRLIGDKECVELQDFLQFLKQRYTWKPSYEQLEALWCAAEKELESDEPNVVELRGKVLESLYNDLKKLTE